MALSSHTKWLRFLNLLLCIVILVLSGSAFTRICTPSNHLNDILENWKRLSIYDISTVSSDDSCAFGYEEVTMSVQWPGTLAGCSCKATSTVTSGACTSSELSSGCSTIPATIPFQMSSWRGRKLCILRGGTSVYWAPDPTSTDCPSKSDIYGNSVDFVKCGSGDTAVCQELSKGCPINQIQLLSSTEPKPAGLSGSAYFGDGYVLYFGTDYTNSKNGPIIDFAISEGSMCLEDPGDVKNSTMSYPLLISKTGECKFTDDRFIKVDSVDEVKFYQDNNLQNLLSLPQLTVNPSRKYEFSYRFSVLWKDVCHQNYYSRSTLNDNKDPFKYILGLHITLLVVQVIISTYLIFGDPLLLYFCYKRSEEEINEYDQPLYSLLLIEKFLKIIMLPIVLTTCITVGYYRNWYYNLDERCCSDSTTNACFGFVDYILDDLYGLDWANFSVIAVVLMVDMISGLCLFVSRTKENYS